VNRVQRRKRVRGCRKRQSVRLAWSIWGHRGAWMTPLLAPAVDTGRSHLPARGLSQYARTVRKFVRMRRLVAIYLPRTYIKCWSELGGHLVHSTPPDQRRQPHRTAGARGCRCRWHFGTRSERQRPEPRLWGSASVCIVHDRYSRGCFRATAPQRPQNHRSRS
jgi:hypothetical protein